MKRTVHIWINFTLTVLLALCLPVLAAGQQKPRSEREVLCASIATMVYDFGPRSRRNEPIEEAIKAELERHTKPDMPPQTRSFWERTITMTANLVYAFPALSEDDLVMLDLFICLNPTTSAGPEDQQRVFKGVGECAAQFAAESHERYACFQRLIKR
jgi:hypothetical protein